MAPRTARCVFIERLVYISVLLSAGAAGTRGPLLHAAAAGGRDQRAPCRPDGEAALIMRALIASKHQPT